MIRLNKICELKIHSTTIYKIKYTNTKYLSEKSYQYLCSPYHIDVFIEHKLIRCSNVVSVTKKRKVIC